MEALTSYAESRLRETYLALTYEKYDFSKYPRRLAEQLVRMVSLAPDSQILDIGCGRGEFLAGFCAVGMSGTGVDQAPRDSLPEFILRESRLKYFEHDLRDSLPFNDESFDLVFSKSVIEHFYHPENVIAEAFRVLRPGGLIITMTPSYKHNQVGFFDDFTHRTPFTLASLDSIHRVMGFSDVQTSYFTQLPFTWISPIFKIVSLLIRLMVPRSWSNTSKLVRFSHELMLITIARKPSDQDPNI